MGGGYGSIASGYDATVAGGYSNTAQGSYATVPGGASNAASGNYSFAAGYRAKADYQGCFVWGDSSNSDVACGGSNRFAVRASGGVYFYTNSAANVGLYIGAGSNVWYQVSDRKAKHDIQEVDPESIVAALEGMPVSTWRYITEESQALHMGPMAQDFHAAFGLGGTDTGITTIDGQGVALAGVKGVHSIVKRQAVKIEEQGAKIDALRDLGALRVQNGQLEERMAKLEGRAEARPAWQGASMYGGAASSIAVLGLAFAVGRRRKAS